MRSTHIRHLALYSKFMLPEFNNTEVAFKYRSNRELKRARFLFSSMAMPSVTKAGMFLTKIAIKWDLPVKKLIKFTLFDQFCGGETMEDAGKTAASLATYGVKTILDYGVEGKESESEFDRAVPEFIKAINYAAENKSIPFISLKMTGFSSFELLEKIHSDLPLSEDEKEAWQRVYKRVDTICRTAAEKEIMVLIDAEESWIQEPVDQLVTAMMAKYNTSKAVVFNTFQLYRHDRLVFLKISHALAQENGYILGAKLVRGAYMEKERKRAEDMGYPSPIQPTKEATDKDYDLAVTYCLEHLNSISLFIGTHNEFSCLSAAKQIDEHNIPHNSNMIYFSQLYGMSDNISFNLAHEGYHVAKYLPYGPVRDVIPYLMRRAQENTSVAGQSNRELTLIKQEVSRRNL